MVLAPQTKNPHDPVVPRAKFVSDKGRMVVEVIDNDIMRIEWSGAQGLPADGEPLLSTPMVAKKAHRGASKLDVRNNGTVLETPTLRVEVDPQTLGLKVFDKRQGKLLSEIYPENLQDRYKKIHIDNTGINDPDIEGLASSPRSAGAIDSGWKRQNAFVPNPYGNGFKIFDDGAPIHNQMPVAFFHNGKDNYALYIDNTAKTEWYFDQANHGAAGMVGDYPRMYLISGKNIPEIHRKFMKIQGMPKMPRESSFGWQVSQFGYENWMELFNDLRALEATGMPLPKSVGLDLQWYGELFGNPHVGPPSQMGTFKFNEAPDKFPHPEETIKWLKDRGIEVVPIFEAYIADNSPHYQTMAEKGYLVKNAEKTGPAFLDPRGGGFWRWKGGYLDASNPEARKFYFDNFVLPIAKKGVNNFWLDLTDPELYDANGKYSNHDGIGENHPENHNIFGNYFSQMIDEGYRRHGINERPTTLSRAQTIGEKGMIWTGDIGNGPESLKAHLRMALDNSWAGQPFVSSDTGGFWRRWPDFRSGQIYTRWLAGVTQTGELPVRVHVFNLDNDKEYLPSKIGEKDSNQALLEEHAAMTPYRISLAWETHKKGVPVRSSPSFYNQKDFGLKGWGEVIVGENDLLVAPALEVDQNQRDVRLPNGNKWVHWETKQEYEGGEVLSNVSTRDSQGRFRHPQYARAGAIFPRAYQERASVTDSSKPIPAKNQDLIVRVFPSNKKSRFTLFEDDGHSKEFESGKFRTTAISQHQVGKALTVEVESAKGTYEGAPTERRQQLEIATQNLDVATVTDNGRSLTHFTDRAAFDNATEGYFLDAQTKMILVKTGLKEVQTKQSFKINYK